MTPRHTSAAGEVRIRQYRDFWDVPRMFVVELRGRTLLFDCPFDDTREDYATVYTVYEMPELSDAALALPWADLAERARGRLGTIAVSDVEFGMDPRTAVDGPTLERLLARQAVPAGPASAGELHVNVSGPTE